MKKAAIFLMVLIIPIFLSASCQGSESNKWIPPKFVKEWEIKEIKHGLPHHIISMTANKNGVFVLVKAMEKMFLLPQKPKKAAEMRLEEKEKFLNTYAPFSATAVLNMTEKEKDEIVDFVRIKLIPAKKANEMTEKEKDEIINFIIHYQEKVEAEVNKRGAIEAVRKGNRCNHHQGDR